MNNYIKRILLGGFLCAAVNCFAADTDTYTTPSAFMNLYFDFTGKGEADFPKNKITIADYLIKSEKSKSHENMYAGPLVMFLDSSLYIYDEDRNLLYSRLMRTNRASGFFEMTAVSHIGPALSYLAKIKENGDPAWKPAMASLLAHIRQVKALNAQMDDNWQDLADIESWQPHRQQIHSMIDYAMSMAGNYIVSVQHGAPFNLASVQKNFLNGNRAYPIPYNSVMVATFMLTALQSMADIHEQVAKLKLDWPHAMVIVRNVAGSNVSSGLTADTNWLLPFIDALSGGHVSEDRILIAPYARVQPDAGQKVLSESSWKYYVYQVWGSIYNRSRISLAVFSTLETIFLPGRPAIPGDHGYSKASDINEFMVRLKFSLSDPREMLSNTAGFWMAGEMKNKNWNIEKIEIPGLTTGFPAGITEYPDQNPPISS